MVKRILLVDCDAYFVQVARLEDPEGAGREPLLLVGGSASGRGVVTSASYECRPFGVRSGMPTARALRLCPRAVVVPVPRGACSRLHREIRTVLERWAPVVSAASIDEFYLDMTGTERLYGAEPLARTAERIRAAAREETRIRVSIGGGTSRLVAKLAVRCAKPAAGRAQPAPGRARPAGVHVVEPGAEAAFLRDLPFRAIPGVGPKTEARLAARGLRTVADAVELGEARLASRVGREFGAWLWQRAHGIDPTPVVPDREARSISRDETFARDIDEDDGLERELLRLVTRAGRDMRTRGLAARTVTVRIRDHDFRTRSKRRTLPAPVSTDRAIYGVGRALLRKLRAARPVPARYLSVALTSFENGAEGPQLGLFEGGEGRGEAAGPRLAADGPRAADGGSLDSERDRERARALDALRARHGADIVRPGRLLEGER